MLFVCFLLKVVYFNLANINQSLMLNKTLTEFLAFYPSINKCSIQTFDDNKERGAKQFAKHRPISEMKNIDWQQLFQSNKR